MNYKLHSQTAGSGPQLILIHGVAGSLRIWDSVMPYLEQHFTVTRLDLLGYGHSPKPHLRYTPAEHIAAIRHTLQKLNIGQPYTLVGLSMGANLVLEFAEHYPGEIARYICIGIPYYPDEAAMRRGLHNNFWTRLTLERPILARLAIPPTWWLGRHNLIPARKLSQIYTKPMAMDALRNPFYAFRSSLTECMIKNPLQAKLAASATIQRLFIHGTADSWAPWQDVAKVVQPYARTNFQTIPGCGHNTAVLEPAQTARLITDYLSDA